MAQGPSGYSLDQQAELREALSDHPEWKLLFVEETTSTQDEVRNRLRSTEADHLCIVADRQTAGRGRQGRSWIQPGGEDIALSLSCPVSDRYPALLLPLLISAALHEVCRDFVDTPLHLKWPNDLLSPQGKVAGILIEGQGPDTWIAGIGLNVGSTEFPPELEGSATSLSLLTDHALDRVSILGELLQVLARDLGDAEAGRYDEIIHRFNTALALAGEAVTLTVRDEPIHGTLDRITPAGVELRDGLSFPLGEVTALCTDTADR